MVSKKRNKAGTDPGESSGIVLRCQWTNAMAEALVDGMVAQVKDGKRADTGFKQEAYIAVLDQINAVNKGEVPIDLERAKNKLSEYKGLYILWKLLLSYSGWSLNPETCVIEAPDEAWDAVIAVSMSCK